MGGTIHIVYGLRKRGSMHQISYTECQNMKKTSEEGGDYMTHQRPFQWSIYLLTLYHFVTDHLTPSTESLGGIGGLVIDQGGGTGRGGEQKCLPESAEPSRTSETPHV